MTIFLEDLKIIATEGFSEEWEIYLQVQRKISFFVFSGVILHLPQIN